MRFLVLSVFLALSLFADSISSFTADKDTGKPNDVVNLDINYVATKKYELHFTAYKNNDGTELSPDFSATDLKNIAYTLPNVEGEIKIVAKLVEDGSVVDSKDVIITNITTIKSCYELYLAGVTDSGTYEIDPDGDGSLGKISVYCDMEHGWTFYYVSGGLRTYKNSDNDSCQEKGLMLFAPTSKTHYEAGRDYVKSIGGNTLGPLGIYHPTHYSSGYCSGCFASNKPMNSYDNNNAYDKGFRSINGGNFWASSRTNISEPNGDYYKNCWLGFSYDSNLNVGWYNDGNCGYSYTSYLCMSKDDAWF